MKRLACTTLCIAAVIYPMLNPLKASAGEFSHRRLVQQGRIFTGVNNDTINAKEYRNLELRTNSVRNQLNRNITDNGNLGPLEKKQLDNRLDNISESIYRSKHNGSSDSN